MENFSIKKLILSEISAIKYTHNNFKKESKKWKKFMVALNDDLIVHISEINFKKLSNKDLFKTYNRIILHTAKY